MEYARLGDSGLRISRVGFGCEQLGGVDWGKFDAEEAARAVGKALDLGIDFFDTADVYGLGRSEEVLSRALGERRHEVVVATKFGIDWEPSASGRARTFRDSSPKRAVEALEASLRRLRLERVSLYQVHWPDPETPIEETLDALLRCQKAGKVQAFGVCNFDLDLLREARRIAPIASIQIPFSLIDRQAEKDLLPYCQREGIGVLAYGPLSQGLLSGKYGPETRFGPDDRRSRLPQFQGERFLQNLRIVERVKEVAARYNRSASQVAIRWVLDRGSISCAIAGAKSPAQVEENAGASGWTLASQDRDFLAA